jgi:hypothetical protein
VTGALLPRPRKHGRWVLRSECACLRAVSHYSAPYPHRRYPYSHYQYAYSRYQYAYSRYQYAYSRYQYPYSRYQYPYSRCQYPYSRCQYPSVRYVRLPAFYGVPCLLVRRVRQYSPLPGAEFYQTHFMDSHTTRELTTMVFSPLLKGEPLKDSDLFVGNTTFRRAVLCRCSIHPRHPQPATAGAQRASTTGRTGPQGCRCRRALPRTALLVHEREPRDVAAVDPGRDFMLIRVRIVQ